jgi:hypothetical protein
VGKRKGRSWQRAKQILIGFTESSPAKETLLQL